MKATFIARVSLGLAAAAFVLLATTTASAQRPLQQVLDLNRQGMDAYNNLDIEAAQAKLQQALDVAQRGHVTGAPLARTYLNLGVSAVGGMSDNGGGLNYFVQALTADPTVQLDPLTSSPDIQTVFNLARARTGASGNNGGNNGRNNPPPPPPPPPPHNNVAGNIPHTPIPEQAVETAVPVFLEVPPDADVAHIYLYYKSQGMPNFRRVEMQHMTGGYGYEIPCTDVFQPSVAYYIEVFGSNGDSVGTAGTDTDPVIVPIVTNLSGPAPHLPGRAAPTACSSEECPPGMPGCHSGGGGGHGTAGMGDTCNGNSDCSEGLHCSDNFCVVGEASGGGSGEGNGEHHDEPADAPPRFFVEVGGTLGIAYASDGMLADSVPTFLNAPDLSHMGGTDFTTNNGGPWQPGPPAAGAMLSGDGTLTITNPDTHESLTLQTAADSEAALHDCSTNNADGMGGYTVSCGVRVNQSGVLLSAAIRAAVGYYITDRFALALTLRAQPVAGTSTLANVLIGLRAQYRLIEAHATGIDLAAFLGIAVGQIQIIPDQGGEYRTWIASGPIAASIGIIATYRFVKNFGLFIQPEIDLLFPAFMFNIDLTAGIQVGF